MDARIGTLMKEGRLVHYAFVDGYNMPPFEGSRADVEQRLGVNVSGGAMRASRNLRVKSWTVTMRFEHPAWDEVDGIEYRNIPARNRSEANRAAARQAESDGHAVSGRGRYWFTAAESVDED